MKYTKTNLAAACALALASPAALATPVPVTAAFTAYSQLGLDQNPGNQSFPAAVSWDMSVTGFIDFAAGTWGVASTTPFFGLNWTTSNGLMISTPGNYALDTATDVVSSAAPDTIGHADGLMHFTVGAGQVAGIIDLAWGTTTGIRIVNVWSVTSNTWCGTCFTTAAIPGMENGPFPGYNFQFILNPCLDCYPDGYIPPAPEASTYSMMLAGLGLVGVAARRRKHTKI